jgi:hypothetical protein
MKNFAEDIWHNLEHGLEEEAILLLVIMRGGAVVESEGAEQLTRLR